jgi:hypothetical protein
VIVGGAGIMSNWQKDLKKFIDELPLTVNDDDNAENFIELLLCFHDKKIFPDDIMEEIYTYLVEENENPDASYEDVELLSIVTNKIVIDPKLEKRCDSYCEYIINGIQSLSWSIDFNELSDATFEYIHSTESFASETTDLLERWRSSIEKQREEIHQQEEKVEKRLQEQEEKIKNLLPQSITTVGIFIAVLMVMFGGLNIIQSFANVASISVIRLMSVGILIAMLVSNCLFLLIFLLSRLVDRPIHTICGNFTNDNVTLGRDMTCHQCYYHRLDVQDKFDKCGNDEKYIEGRKCGFVKKAFVRYPWFWIANIAFVLSFFPLVTIWVYGNAENAGIIEHKVLFVFLLVFIEIIFCTCIGVWMVYTGKIDGVVEEKDKTNKAKVIKVPNNFKKIRIRTLIISVILIGVALYVLGSYALNIVNP